MHAGWIYCIAGMLFCLGGVYLFFRNVFEENRRITNPILVIIGGIFLIGVGMAKLYGLD